MWKKRQSAEKSKKPEQCENPGLESPPADSATGPNIPGAALGVGAREVIQAKRGPIPVEHTQMRMLATIKGVSMATAKLFLQHYDMVDVLMQKPDSQSLAELVYDSGFRVGESRARDVQRRLSGLSSDIKQSAALLSCVDRVSVDCAQFILSRVSLDDLIRGDLPAGAIAELRRGDKSRRLGACIEASIRAAFVRTSAPKGGGATAQQPAQQPA
jgi:hypothetical protein